jgi:hypothetical protein
MSSILLISSPSSFLGSSLLRGRLSSSPKSGLSDRFIPNMNGSVNENYGLPLGRAHRRTKDNNHSFRKSPSHLTVSVKSNPDFHTEIYFCCNKLAPQKRQYRASSFSATMGCLHFGHSLIRGLPHNSQNWA